MPLDFRGVRSGSALGISSYMITLNDYLNACPDFFDFVGFFFKRGILLIQRVCFGGFGGKLSMPHFYRRRFFRVEAVLKYIAQILLSVFVQSQIRAVILAVFVSGIKSFLCLAF